MEKRTFAMQAARTSGTHVSGNCGQRDGVSALEFALILPIFLTLILGAIDFGRFAHSLIAVTNASRAGAGLASVHPTTNATLANWQAEVRATVLAELSQTLPSTGLVAGDVTTTVPAPVTSGNGASLRKSVSVTVTIPFRSIVSWPLLPQNVTLTKTTVFRAIR